MAQNYKLNIVKDYINTKDTYCILDDNDIKFIKIKPVRYIDCFKANKIALKTATFMHTVNTLIDEYKTINISNKTQLRKYEEKVNKTTDMNGSDTLDFSLEIYVDVDTGNVISYNNQNSESEGEIEEDCIQSEELLSIVKYRFHSEFEVELRTQEHEEDGGYSKIVFKFYISDKKFHKLIDFLHTYYMDNSPEYRQAYEKVSKVAEPSVTTPSNTTS